MPNAKAYRVSFNINGVKVPVVFYPESVSCWVNGNDEMNPGSECKLEDISFNILDQSMNTPEICGKIDKYLDEHYVEIENQIEC